VKEMAEALRQMSKEKLEQAEKHLARLEELHKANEDISFRCKSVCEKMAEIDSLRSQLDQERKEKLEFHGKV